jgi:hypothetical protein
MARQIGMQGGANQQAMAGQAATLQAQQQLAAQQALMQQQAQMANLATQQVGQYGAQLGNLNQSTLGNYQATLAAIGGQNQVAASQQANINDKNAGFIGSLMGGIGGAINGGGGAAAKGATGGAGGGAGFYDGGSVMDSHHDAYASIYHPQMAGGGKVPGEPKVAGDHPKNDTVPAMLSPGEIVIPNSILQGKNPIEDAAKFVASELSKQDSAERNDFHAALEKAISSRKRK